VGGRSVIVTGNPKVLQKFERDKGKSNSCLEERKFDFAYATQLWKDENRITFDSPRPHSNETRTVNVGKIEGKHYAVVSTDRGDSIRIISARRAREKEVTLYEQNYTYTRNQ